MLKIPLLDRELDILVDNSITPGEGSGVLYRIHAKLGAGGMSAVFRATRVSQDGEAPAVVKMMLPWFVRQSGRNATLAFQKEATALSQLNDRVPPTPFVVRLLGLGAVHAEQGDHPLVLPWLALEYVHGGNEGTTLAQRVESTVSWSGFAFDPERIERFLHCLSEGMTAVHEMGVIHRDIKPDNVLCCGFGQEEIFKISDFGVARPGKLSESFSGLAIGTPGYAAPEQVGGIDGKVGPFTDVFACASLIYFVMTGEPYFDVSSSLEALAVTMTDKRRSVLQSTKLSPDLRDRPEVCQAIDEILAHATASRPSDRPHTIAALVSMLLPLVSPPTSRRVPISKQHVEAIFQDNPVSPARWVWTVRHRTLDTGPSHLVIRSVAWNSDGTCLAASTQGLAFWDGTGWRTAADTGFPVPNGVHVVQQVSPARWLLGGEHGALAMYNASGVHDVLVGASADACITHASGALEDLAVVAATYRGSPPVLHGIAARRWMRPLPLEDASYIATLSRISDTQWLVGGRATDSTPYLAMYEPMFWSVSRINVHQGRAILASAGQPLRNAAIAAGASGTVIWLEGNEASHEAFPGDFALSAVALDIGLNAWAASTGQIWMRHGGATPSWTQIWSDPTSVAPIVSLHAEPGWIMAMTADGGLIEGRQISEVLPRQLP